MSIKKKTTKKKTRRDMLIKRVEWVKVKLGDGDLILSVPEEEFLDRTVWSIQEFLRSVS